MNHPDSEALVWQGLPAASKPKLLRNAGCHPLYVAACADARWAALPDKIQAGLRPQLDPKTVAWASRNLKKREADE